LDNKIDDLVLPSLINSLECLSKFIDGIKSCANDHFPLKKPYKFRVSTPWWDAECTAAIRARKEAEKNYNSVMTQDNFFTYQMNAAKTRKLLSTKKKLGWTRFCENLCPRTPASIVWKQIKRFRGSCDIGNVSANDPDSWLEAFSNKLSPFYVPNKEFSSTDDLPCILRSFLKFSRIPHPVVQYPINPLYSSSYDALIHNPTIITDFGIDKSTVEAGRVFLQKVNTDFNGWLNVFTDASKVSDSCPVGAAVWIPKYKIILSFKCPSVTSVFTGESIAILEAILYSISHNLDKTIIFTDSKSCLQSLLCNPFRDKS
ncbi:putative ORF2, partial [Operophtera brumata]